LQEPGGGDDRFYVLKFSVNFFNLVLHLDDFATVRDKINGSISGPFLNPRKPVDDL